MSRKSKVRITGELRKLAFHNKTQRGIQDLAYLLNPKIRGWIQYYGKISRKSLQPIFYGCGIDYAIAYGQTGKNQNEKGRTSFD